MGKMRHIDRIAIALGIGSLALFLSMAGLFCAFVPDEALRMSDGSLLFERSPFWVFLYSMMLIGSSVAIVWASSELQRFFDYMTHVELELANYMDIRKEGQKREEKKKWSLNPFSKKQKA